MKFNISYTKLGNQFFFISNLTEWHFSCRPNYNPIWLKEIKGLSPEEEKALKTFSNILKKYGFKSYLGIPFYTHTNKNTWDAVKKWVNKAEYAALKNIFAIFDEKFNKAWDAKIMDNNIRIFEKELAKKCYTKIDKHLEDFLGKYNKNKSKKINIFLLKHPAENSYIAGGANLGNKGVTIECNRLIPKDISTELAVSITYHEFIHLAYQDKLKKEFAKILSKEVGDKIPLIQNRSLPEVSIEIIIDSLFPDGYLAEKYFRHSPYKKIRVKMKKYKEIFEQFQQGKKVDFNKLQYYIVYKLSPLTKGYIENKKRLDAKYIKTVLFYLKNELQF